MEDRRPHEVTPEEAGKMDCAMRPDERWCNGPNCMAWRWQELPVIRDGVLQYEPRYSKTHGYCGMVRL